MSLAKTLNGGTQSLKVHIDDIRVNPNNDYEINEDEVISLSLSIENMDNYTMVLCTRMKAKTAKIILLFLEKKGIEQ